jgi:hypothetical protein
MCLHKVRRAGDLSGTSFIRTLILFIRTPNHDLMTFWKLNPYIITLGIRTVTYEFRGNTITQAIPVATLEVGQNLRKVRCRELYSKRWSKELGVTSAGEMKMEPSHTASGLVRCCNYFGKQFYSFSNIK